MDSSAKYQKFLKAPENEDSEGLSHEHDSRSKRLMISVLLVTIIVLVAVFFVATFAIGLGVGVGVSHKNEAQTGVTVIAISPAELEGEYYSPEGAGSIRFHSSVNDTHFVLSVFTTNGELLVTITQPLFSNMTLMGINDTYFLVMKNQPERPKYDDYIIPNDMMNTMESVMRGEGEMTENILNHLNKSDVNEVRQATLYDFTMSQEAELIIEAALGLGELEIQGTDYPAVMQFYQLALRLAKTRFNIIDESKSTNSSLSRSTRDTHSLVRSKRLDICENSDRSYENCAEVPYQSPFGGDNCFGLCGYNCCCWSFVCGDCCRHRFCETHDGCCAQKGFFTFDCFRVAVDVFTTPCLASYDCM